MIYNIFKYQYSVGDFNWLTDDIRLLLVNNYTFNADTHQYVSDVISSEVSGNGYTSGGVNLTDRQVSRNDIEDRVIYIASNVIIPNTTIRTSGCIIYKRVTSNTNSYLINYISFGQERITNNTSFRINWSQEEGIFYLK